MHRLNQTFLAIVVLSALLGGVAAADYTRTLGDAEDAGLIKTQVQTELLSADVEDGEFVLSLRIENPTQFSLGLNGAYAVASADDDRISYGTIVNHDKIPPHIPSQGGIEVTYRFALSDDQAQRLSRALEEGPVKVNGQHSVRLHETKFSIPFSGQVGGS